MKGKNGKNAGFEWLQKNSAGVASLRGQGTPAYPARLRSERARNSSKYFLPQVQETAQECFLPQGRRSFKNSCCRKVAKALQVQPCGFFAAATDRATVNQEAETSLPEVLYFSSSPRRNS